MGVVGDGGAVRTDDVAKEIVDVAVVTEDDVVAVAERGRLTGVGDDHVATGAAEDHVAADPGGDRVVATELTRRRGVALDQSEDRNLVVVVGAVAVDARDRAVPDRLRTLDPGDATVVAEDDVLASAAIDGVAADAARDDVVTGLGADGVDGAEGLVNALDEVQDRVARAALDVEHPAMVTEDDIGFTVALDGVGAVAAEDPVPSAVTGEDIVATVLRTGGHDLADPPGALDPLRTSGEPTTVD